MTTKGSIDRRVARTRAAVEKTHLKLILKKGYEAVTIQDICDEANIGRSTFYAHYRTKDDLKRVGLQNLRHLLVERQKAALAAPGGVKDRSLGFSLTMFEHAREHIDLYRALVGSDGEAVALGAIRQILCDLVRHELSETAEKNASDTIERELTVQYVVGAYMAMLTWWLDGSAKLSAHQVDAMFRRLATEGIVPHAIPRDVSR